MAAGTAYKARTAPAIVAGILLLLVPPTFLAYEFFLYASVSGTASLQAGQLMDFLRQFGLADVLVFVILPIVTAIAAFKRGKGFLAVMAILFALAWAFDLWTCVKIITDGGQYGLGFLIQMGLWAIAWLVLFIVSLVGMRKALVGARPIPWILGLGALIAAAFQWLYELGGFGNVSFDGSNLLAVAALTDLGANFILALAVLLLSAAVGKASSKEARAMADAKAAKKAAKEKAKQEKALKKGKHGDLPASTSVGAAATAASIGTAGVSATPSYGFTPAPETIELSAKGDPFAGAMAALDEASGKISLTLDGASSPSSAGSASSSPAYGTAATGATAGTSTTVRQMSDLKALLDEGILTQAEYEAAKAKVSK